MKTNKKVFAENGRVRSPILGEEVFVPRNQLSLAIWYYIRPEFVGFVYVGWLFYVGWLIQRLNLDGGTLKSRWGTLNLDGGTLTLDRGKRPSYNLSTDFMLHQFGSTHNLHITH